MTVSSKDLELYLNAFLDSSQYQDYAPNGLQVQGRSVIRRIATGVTASLAFLDAALQWGADAVLVHHGYFWKNEARPITGQRYARLRTLLQNDLNLFAYHLPLDAHPEVGNNAQLAHRLGLIAQGRFGEGGLGWIGQLPQPVTLKQWLPDITQALNRPPLVLGNQDIQVQRVAWCTGAAQNLFAEAIEQGAQVYISGEVSESTQHLAVESAVAYLAAGHHATERYGVQALGAHIAQQFGVEHQFIDIENPV
jgi:dinuclear metal center YbgI/SA1388 family protein